LEPLEERRMFSADTTLASLAGVLPVTVVGTYVTASQPHVNANVVFLGDSITWGYKYGMGAPIWQSSLSDVGAADYGVIGATTQSLLYQLSLGQLAGVYPSVVVLTIGTNNLLGGDSPEATARGVLANVNLIHQFEPQAQVLVLGVPPGGASPHDPYRNQVIQTNAAISQMLAGDSRATFVNIAPAFEDGGGSISNLSMFDSIHPTPLGYANLTATLLPPIAQASLAGGTLRAAR
jgi:lysophospholipase L1-like esterase